MGIKRSSSRHNGNKGKERKQRKNGKGVSGLGLSCREHSMLTTLDISGVVTRKFGYFEVNVGGHSVVRIGGNFVDRNEDIVCVVIKEVA